MSLLRVFDEIVEIIHNDYAGLIEKKGWDKPEIYKEKLIQLENNNALNREIFQELVKDYLLDLKDKHVALINKSETKPIMSNGFKVRRFEDKLYITEVKEENKLNKGMKILSIDGKKVLDLIESNKRILKAELAEREDWESVLIKSISCMIEDLNGNIFEFNLDKYPYKTNASNYSLELLKEDILFLKINDFADSNQLFNLINSNKKLLESTKNLIIDLRVNGGGSDSTYDPLLKYIFPPSTNIMADEVDGIFMYMTERNYKNRSEYINEWLKTLKSTDEIKEVNNFLEELKMILNKGFSEIEMHKNLSITVDGTLLPEKAIVLIDRYCGSSGDQFALVSSYSSKVKLIGRNTSGVIDYSNVAFEKFEEYGFELWYPTSKSKRVIYGKGIDNIGVKPDIYIPWTPKHLEKDIDLEVALDFLENNISDK